MRSQVCDTFVRFTGAATAAALTLQSLGQARSFTPKPPSSFYLSLKQVELNENFS
jgi:hypothetical protein